jgi:CHAD domain-containing protein
MKARKVSGLDPSGPLRDNAERIVATRLEELDALAAAALEPSAETAQHDMRIAAKRLRYVLDVLAGCLAPDAGAIREAAKQLQTVLGEIHDCDVMLPRVSGIESVEALLRARRELLFVRFRELWSELVPALAAP